jgi:hypothetical protein
MNNLEDSSMSYKADLAAVTQAGKALRWAEKQTPNSVWPPLARWKGFGFRKSTRPPKSPSPRGGKNREALDLINDPSLRLCIGALRAAQNTAS